jgi:hypothetical protein
MSDNINRVRAIVTELETIQRQIGQAQVELLGILTDDTQDEWDQSAQAGLVRLEVVQRSIGEVQVLLVEHLPAFRSARVLASVSATTTIDEDHESTSATAVIVEVEQVPLSFVDPVEWLEQRGIKIKSLPAVTGIDNSADSAALFLGDNFDVLENFFEALKRAVNRNYNEGWFSVEDLPGTAIGAICEFATKLHGCGFFTSFRYFKRNVHKPTQKPGIRFSTLQDARVNRFFRGGWLERYVEQVAREVAQTAFGAKLAIPILREVQVVLPTGADAEFDLLAGLPGGQVMWLESKTGEWRPYVPRFQELNKRFLKLPSGAAALVVVEKLSEDEKASISALSGMHLIRLTELREHLNSRLSLSSKAEV